jgi:hypothetical protein
MRKNAMWRGKKLRTIPFLGLEDLMNFVTRFGIPVEEITIFECA